MNKLPLLLFIIPLFSFGQSPTTQDTTLKIQNYNGPVDFAVVEGSPIFPGCENLEIDGEVKEISARINTLNSIYKEVKNLNEYLLLNKNQKIIKRLLKKKDESEFNKAEKKFIEKIREGYMYKINLQLQNLNNDSIVSYIHKQVIDNYNYILLGEKFQLMDYISLKIQESKSDLKKAEIYLLENESLLLKNAQKNCLNKGIRKHIKKNFKYPKIAKEMGVQEKIYVKFVIDKTGSIINVKVVRGDDKYLREEAVRLVKSIPKMTPANQRGKPVSINYTIPINFQLN